MSSNLSSFYSRTRDARKVIVVDLGFLGDTIHLVPALWELKRNYPQATLHVLTSNVGAELLQLVSCVDRAWPLDQDPAKRTLSEQWRTMKAVRRERFDVAFNFVGADRTIFLTALTGAEWRVAYPGGRRHVYNRWLVPHWTPPQDPDRAVFEQRRQVLAACGVPLVSPRFDLRISEELSRWAAGIVPPFAIHISPNSSKPTREWPVEHHAAMLKEVWATQPEVRVLVSSSGKERERERLRALASRVNDPRLQVLPENLTIPQLAAVLSRCRLHLGPDSGVLHLAVALGLATVSFFREQGAFKSFMPMGTPHRVITMPCPCVDHHDSPCERLGQGECFTKIEPARVAALVREQLARGAG